MRYNSEFYYPTTSNLHQHQHHQYQDQSQGQQQPMAAAADPIWIPANEATSTDQLGLYGDQPLEYWYNNQMASK